MEESTEPVERAVASDSTDEPERRAYIRLKDGTMITNPLIIVPVAIILWLIFLPIIIVVWIVVWIVMPPVIAVDWVLKKMGWKGMLTITRREPNS